MRLALPFSQTRCGAFSCAACIATFGNFSYAVFLMRFAPPPIQTTINFFPHSPSVAFPLAKIPAPWLFLCGFFLCALYHHLRQFFLCALHYHLRKRGVAFSCALCATICGSFFYAVCASIFASAVWRLFLCCLHCRFQQFFLCGLRCHLRERSVPLFSYALCAAICASAVWRLFLCCLCRRFRKFFLCSFSYAVCAAAYPNHYKLLSPLAIRRFPAGENTCTMAFPMRLFFRALRCHFRQFFLCGFSYSACAAIFASAVWRLFLCYLHCHFRKFFLCGFSFTLCAAICGSFSYAACVTIYANAVWRLFLCCLLCSVLPAQRLPASRTASGAASASRANPARTVAKICAARPSPPRGLNKIYPCPDCSCACSSLPAPARSASVSAARNVCANMLAPAQTKSRPRSPQPACPFASKQSPSAQPDFQHPVPPFSFCALRCPFRQCRWCRLALRRHRETLVYTLPVFRKTHRRSAEFIDSVFAGLLIDRPPASPGTPRLPRR